MRRAAGLILCLLVLNAVALVAGAQNPTFDLVIRNGHVVDGTGNPWSRGDVAIRGDRIVAVGVVPPEALAKCTIDATGLVVAPGFIDAHSHSDWVLFEDGDASSKIRQGVTTDILGEDRSGGPHRGRLAPRAVEVGDETVQLTSLDDYFRAIEQSGTAINVASYVGLGNVWACVMGDSFDRPTQDQLREMESILDDAMREGALGLSTMLAAPQEMVSTVDDLADLARVVARYNGTYASHIRSEGIDVLAAIGEAIEVGRRSGAGRDHPPQDCRSVPLGPDGRDRRDDRSRPR